MVDSTNPSRILANGEFFAFGFANSPAIQAEVGAWYDAATLDQEKAAARRLNKAAMDHVVYAPLGWYLRHYAWRKNVTGIVPSPTPFFWGVSKAA